MLEVITDYITPLILDNELDEEIDWTKKILMISWKL